MSKIDHSLFAAHEHALEEQFGACPDCGAKLHIRSSKSGPFLGCSQYPKCHFSKPLHDNHTTQLKVIDGSQCPECGAPMAIKKGRYGLFIGCTQFPECHHIETAKKQDSTHLTCPACDEGQLIKRTNKFGKSFYACDGYPKCKYAVNHPPRAVSCPSCHWPIMLEMKKSGVAYLVCPQKKCGHKLEQ